MDTLVSTLFFFIHTYKRACDFGVGMALSTAKTFRLLRSAHYAIINYFCAIISHIDKLIGRFKMAISSINIQTSTAHSFKHNDRTDTPNYLIDSPSLNECNKTHEEAQALLESYIKEAEQYRKNYGLRAMKSNTIKSVEAVVNLNASHTLQDVEKLAKTIEKEFGVKKEIYICR